MARTGSSSNLQASPPPTLKFEDFYKLGDRLGSGAFAVVYTCTRKNDGALFACKVMEKTHLNQDIVAREVSIMQAVEHPNLVRLCDFFENETKIWIVVEWCRGGELFDKLCKRGSLSEKEVKGIAVQILNGLACLHSKSFVHRDLKPENVLFYSGEPDSEVKISDFGLADKLTADGLRLMCGTPEFIAPEVIKGDPYRQGVDMWSFGVMLYVLLCGFPPFSAEKVDALYDKISAGVYDFPAPYWSDITPMAKDLIGRLLQVNPSERYTVHEALQHPWIVEDGGERTAGPLPTVLEMMRAYNATRKFKKAIFVAMSVQRLAKLGKVRPAWIYI
eukprot:tig00000057_g94.t1